MALPTLWPREIPPHTTTFLDMDGPLLSQSHSGKWNRRSTTQQGRRWTETYVFETQSTNGRALMASANYYWRSGNYAFINHYHLITVNGAAGGSPRINGTNQTGATLAVENASNSITGWLVTGDVFLAGGHLFDVLDDADTDGSGDVELHINPPMYGAMASGVALTLLTGGRSIKAIVVDIEMPETDAAEFGVMKVTFEVVAS